jgi:hypothetical protein
MNREAVIRMAREAGFEVYGTDVWITDGWWTEELERFASLVAASERNKLAAWMIQFGFATGHGDTMEQLVDALGSEIVDRIECEIDTEREACAKVCDVLAVHPEYASDITKVAAQAIRARGNQ